MYNKMDSGRILLVFGLLLAGASCRSSLFSGNFEEPFGPPNSLSPIGGIEAPRRMNWVKVVQTTGRVVRVSEGQRVELICTATGSPSPSIQWFKGSRPITPLQAFKETNDITGSGLGSVTSKYVIDCAQAIHQGTYTCTGVAGGESSATPPTALIVEGSIPSVLRACNDKSESKTPQIVVSRTVVLEENNNDVVLPCVARGTPKPNIFWLDEDNKLIDNTKDARIKILDSGDLSISRIRWTDMGRYMCVAENKEGRDTATTFLYPLRNDD